MFIFHNDFIINVSFISNIEIHSDLSWTVKMNNGDEYTVEENALDKLKDAVDWNA